MECRIYSSPALQPRSIAYTVLCSLDEEIGSINEAHRVALKIWEWIKQYLDVSPPIFTENEAIGMTHIIYRYRMSTDKHYLSLRIVTRNNRGEIAVTTIPEALAPRLSVEPPIYSPMRDFQEYITPREELPPGQYVIPAPIIYRILGQPCLDCRETGIIIAGMVEKPLQIHPEDLNGYPTKNIVADLHCVTGWTVKNIAWTGVPLKYLLEEAGVRKEAKYGLIYGLDGYSAVVPLLYLLDEDTLLATHMNHEPIPPEHGGPVRLVVPALYGWKSVKWVSRILLLDRYLDGFWESLGYHERGSPWLEERFKRPL
ncbi:MAG: molybdopterin-dependent oxidoreductase [Crenarchaeota archaeon]|nr:molybdopterin-dependent oxidoreductase [Thermoproteota archaeon]